MQSFCIGLILFLGVCPVCGAGQKVQPAKKLGAVIPPSGTIPPFILGGTRLLIVDVKVGDGLHIGYGGEQRDVLLLDMETGKEIRRFQGHKELVQAIAFSPDGKFVLTGSGRLAPKRSNPSKDNSARLWDVATGKEVRGFLGHKQFVHAVQFSPDGKRILTAGRDNTLRIWEVDSGKELFVFSDVNGISPGAAFSPDGRLVICMDILDVKLWDSLTGKILTVLKNTGVSYGTAEFDPTSTVVVTTSSEKLVQTWDAKTGRELRTFVGHTGWLRTARFTPDGKKIISAATDGTVRLWNANTGEEIKRFNHKGAVTEILLSGNGKYLFTRWCFNPDNLPLNAEHGGTLWNIESGKEIIQRRDIIAFSPDGGKFLTFESLRDLENGRPVSWWDAETGKVIPRKKR